MEIATALSSLKALADLAQVALKSRDDAKAQEAIAGMQAKLLDIYASAFEVAERNSSLQATVRSLESKIADLEAKLEEKARCQLTPVGRGAFAYALLDPATKARQKPPVYFCQHCYDKGIKSILRYFDGAEWGGPEWKCTEHNSHSIGA
jgi:cell division protein FtsB